MKMFKKLFPKKTKKTYNFDTWATKSGFSRKASSQQKDGYFWEPFLFIEGGQWVEGDDLLRKRIEESYKGDNDE